MLCTGKERGKGRETIFFRKLMVETTTAGFSLRQQKSTLANRSSPGQPITTIPDSV